MQTASCPHIQKLKQLIRNEEFTQIIQLPFPKELENEANALTWRYLQIKAYQRTNHFQYAYDNYIKLLDSASDTPNTVSVRCSILHQICLL